MNVTLWDVAEAARARVVPFAGESAGYLVLQACERLLLGPHAFRARDAVLDREGNVSVLATRAGGAEEAERDLRELLGTLLEVASSPGPSLRRVVARGSHTGLVELGRELERALIPFNKSAARRALVRLHRETERALSSGRVERSARRAAAANDAVERAPEVEHAAPTRSPAPSFQALPVVERRFEPSARTPRLGSLEVATAEAVRRPPPPFEVERSAEGGRRDHEEETTHVLPIRVERSERSAEYDELLVESDELVFENDEPAAEDDPETNLLRRREKPKPPLPRPAAELLRGFAVVAGPDEAAVRRELKAIAGLEPTPAPLEALRAAANDEER